MYAEDLLVLIYPNLKNVKAVIIVDPFDKKVEFYPVDSIDEVKEILRSHLPFCYQHSEPTLHLGSAYVLEWESLPSNGIEIYKPQDINKALS